MQYRMRSGDHGRRPLTRGLAALMLMVVGCGEQGQEPFSPSTAEEPGAEQGVAALAASNTWTTRAPMPTARSQLAAGAISGIVYAIGGRSTSGVVLRTVQAYNTSTNAWTTRSQLPSARAMANGATTISGRLYVSGGFNSSYAPTRTLYVYNPATNTWATKAQMPLAGSSGVQAAINGQLYVYTMVAVSSGGHRFFRYNPATNAWTTLSLPPNQHCCGAAGGVIDGKFYLAGGSPPNIPGATDALDVYDPATNTWTTRASMPAARTGMGGHVLKAKLFAVGGSDLNGAVVSTAEVYNPATNAWGGKAPLPTARYQLAVVPSGGLLYALGGATTDQFDNVVILATNEAYTP